MSRWLRWGLCGGLLIYGVLPAGAAAQHSPPLPTPQETPVVLGQRPEPGGLPASRLLARALGLTPEQVRRMQEVRRQESPAIQSAGRKVAVCRRRLNDAIYGLETSEALVEQRARELAAAEADLIQLRARLQYRIRTVLTDEQLRVFNELRTEPPQDVPRRGMRRPGRLDQPPTP